MVLDQKIQSGSEFVAPQGERPRVLPPASEDQFDQPGESVEYSTTDDARAKPLPESYGYFKEPKTFASKDFDLWSITMVPGINSPRPYAVLSRPDHRFTSRFSFQNPLSIGT
jgi:hypothetical protein